MICPLCTTRNDPALTPSGRLPPRDWHPFVCLGCTAVLVIDHTWPGGARVPDDDDWTAWQADPLLTIALIRTLNAYQSRKEN